MKEKLELKYSGTSIICDHCGYRMMVSYEDHEPVQTFGEDAWYTKHEYMPFFNGDEDGSVMEREADFAGWKCVNGKHFCPDCWGFQPSGEFRNIPEKYIGNDDACEGLFFTADGGIYYEDPAIDENGNEIYKRVED